MAGYELKSGCIKNNGLAEKNMWACFNYVFSDRSKKRNSYKFGFIKAMLDSVFHGVESPKGFYYLYEDLFERFAANYWNLVTKYQLKQMRPDSKSQYSKVEKIIKSITKENAALQMIEYEVLDSDTREGFIKEVTRECKKYVIGALYEDFDESIYEFDLKGEGLTLSKCYRNFMIKYKPELEKLNYYAWARFLYQINDDEALVRVLDKLELATPRRNDLSVYRQLLLNEFSQDTCFYCGRKLGKEIHVDHFIPWSFAKDDKIWNFVLTCPKCNLRKNNQIPDKDYLVKIQARNGIIRGSSIPFIEMEFEQYSDAMMESIWEYAQKDGFKIMNSFL